MAVQQQLLITPESLDVSTLGQFFTPPRIVERMLKLRQNTGRFLEPSAGEGAFLSQMDSNGVGIEIDQRLISDKRVRHVDFFAYADTDGFATIIGNPPYVKYQNIRSNTKFLLSAFHFDKRANLYLFFIDRCLDLLKPGGELIFITPRDFLKATSARFLNQRLANEGSFTDFDELGDAEIFEGATPNCAIWRWEKDRASKTMMDGREFCFRNGQIWFGQEQSGRLADVFDVKVGAISGANDIFTSQAFGTADLVCSTTVRDGSTRRMIYQTKIPLLEKYKARLLARTIRVFTEANWWEWGRAYHQREGERIYVNCKTRDAAPFFVSSEEAYDGSVLALLPKQAETYPRLGGIADQLNKVDWDGLGFVCDGRFLFTQNSLANAPVSV